MRQVEAKRPRWQHLRGKKKRLRLPGSERRQRPSLNTKSKSLSAPVKSSPNIGEHWKDLKGIGSVFLSPTAATMLEQLFELESVLSEGSHVCPTGWMSCIRQGLKTLFLITFKCSVFWELPVCNRSPCEALMIGVNGRQRKLLEGKRARGLSQQTHRYYLCLYLCSKRLISRYHWHLQSSIFMVPLACTVCD